MLKEKTNMTLHLLVKVKKADQDIVRLFDDQMVSQLYDEKILLFDKDMNLIYSSVGDTPLRYPGEIINRLKAGEKEISYTEDGFDVIAHHIRYKNADYYALGKAYDNYGRSKLRFLGDILLGTFCLALLLMFLLNAIISRKITTPISRLISEMDQITANNLQRVYQPSSNDEIARLSAEFNKMLNRMELAFNYQKNLVHHISHELKTPIAVLISNIERQTANSTSAKNEFLDFQKAGLMQLADIINTLLEISRFEQIRPEHLAHEIHLLDLLFECAEEIQYITPDTHVEMKVDESVHDASTLNVPGNERLLKIAFRNLIKNAADYSTDKHLHVRLSKNNGALHVAIENNGPALSTLEQKKLFIEYFRGANSQNKSGFGLGLVMVNKILQLHQATIEYHINAENRNEFLICFARPV